MLWQRVLTAVALLPPLLWALFALPSTGIAILIGVVVTVATWELTVLIGLSTLYGRFLYTFLIATFGTAGSLWLLQQESLLPVFAVATGWWLYALFYIFRRDRNLGGVFTNVVSRMVAGCMVMVPTWLGFLALYTSDIEAPSLLLYVLVLVWVADTFAYFSGKAWGRTRLAPTISPGKSVEGAIGGLVGVAIIATVAGQFYWQHEGIALFMWIGLSLLTGVVSIVGDLTESAFKRRVGVKDSGTLLPGHGGIFDRIDALTAALPVFAFGWQLIQASLW